MKVLRRSDGLNRTPNGVSVCPWCLAYTFAHDFGS